MTTDGRQSGISRQRFTGPAVLRLFGGRASPCGLRQRSVARCDDEAVAQWRRICTHVLAYPTPRTDSASDRSSFSNLFASICPFMTLHDLQAVTMFLASKSSH